MLEGKSTGHLTICVLHKRHSHFQQGYGELLLSGQSVLESQVCSMVMAAHDVTLLPVIEL